MWIFSLLRNPNYQQILAIRTILRHQDAHDTTLTS